MNFSGRVNFFAAFDIFMPLCFGYWSSSSTFCVDAFEGLQTIHQYRGIFIYHLYVQLIECAS